MATALRPNAPKPYTTIKVLLKQNSCGNQWPASIVKIVDSIRHL